MYSFSAVFSLSAQPQPQRREKHHHIPDVIMWARRTYDNHLSLYLHSPTPNKHTPAPLPLIRERRLTTPLPLLVELDQKPTYRNQRSKQTTSPQSQSSLLSILPIELRLAIYEEVLTDTIHKNVLHILRQGKKLGHWRCRIHSSTPSITCDATKTRCMEGFLAYRQKHWRLDEEGKVSISTDKGMLALLLTCRMVYSEAVAILYQRNRFHFQDWRDVGVWKNTILMERWDSVRSLVLDVGRVRKGDFRKIGNDGRDCKWEQGWADLWQDLGRMDSLLEVTVVVKSDDRADEGCNEGRMRICEPMMAIQGLWKFDLIVPEREAEMWKLIANDAPFRVVSSSSPVIE